MKKPSRKPSREPVKEPKKLSQKLEILNEELGEHLSDLQSRYGDIEEDMRDIESIIDWMNQSIGILEEVGE